MCATLYLFVRARMLLCGEKYPLNVFLTPSPPPSRSEVTLSKLRSLKALMITVAVGIDMEVWACGLRVVRNERTCV